MKKRYIFWQGTVRIDRRPHLEHEHKAEHVLRPGILILNPSEPVRHPSEKRNPDDHRDVA